MAKANTQWGTSNFEFAVIAPEVKTMLEQRYSRLCIHEIYVIR